MKILAISGSNAEGSFNMALLKFMAKHLANKYDFEVTSVRGLPMFKEGVDAPQSVLTLGDKIQEADLVLIASPEQQHSVSSSLKSALEWLSSAIHPFNHKPVVIVSTSPMPQGASRSQLRLRSILLSPGFGCHLFNGDEFLMGFAPKQFKENGDLVDENTVKFMDHFFNEVDAWYEMITK